jgi:hypothetical protein
MAEWYKIKLTLPSGTSEETKESICNHFLEKDYDFPRNCINGESSYRNPQLGAKEIIQDLYENFNIDDAKLQFECTEDDLNENHKIYLYKSLFREESEKKKVYDFLLKMIQKYELSNRSKLSCSLSISQSRYNLHVYFYFKSDGVEYESRYSKYFLISMIENEFVEIEKLIEKFSKILNVIETTPYSESFKVNNYE